MCVYVREREDVREREEVEEVWGVVGGGGRERVGGRDGWMDGGREMVGVVCEHILKGRCTMRCFSVSNVCAREGCRRALVLITALLRLN